jgi:hypothetical protein
MATKQQSDTTDFVESIRASYADAIDAYDRQAKKTLAQGETLVKDLPVVRQLVGIQADLARSVVDFQTWGARLAVGA